MTLDLDEIERLAREAITYADWDRDMLALIAAIRERDAEVARLTKQLEFSIDARNRLMNDAGHVAQDCIDAQSERDSLRRQRDEALDMLAKMTDKRDAAVERHKRDAAHLEGELLRLSSEVSMLAHVLSTGDAAPLLGQAADARSDRDRHRPVYDAACAWRDDEIGVGYDPLDVLRDAVDAARKAGVK